MYMYSLLGDPLHIFRVCASFVDGGGRRFFQAALGERNMLCVVVTFGLWINIHLKVETLYTLFYGVDIFSALSS